MQINDHYAIIFHQFKVKFTKIRIQKSCGDPKG